MGRTTPHKKYPDNISNFSYSRVWPIQQFMNKSCSNVDVVKELQVYHNLKDICISRFTRIHCS